MFFAQSYDVIVVGGGHAGAEAALASARMGAKTLLLTHSIETLGQLSCNPAIGGIGKGHLVREIDALGGLMARAADKAGIHFRTLNASKGPAVRATRCQADRQLYREAVRQALETQPGLDIFQQAVDDLVLEGDQVAGVITQMGLGFRARAVVLTVGTFLGGLIHIGLSNYQGGRAGDPPANALARRLRELNLSVGRLKTGTPPRIDSRSIDYSQLDHQPGDTPRPVFSFLGSTSDHPRQVVCHITHTNERTHEIIRGGLSHSPMYAGIIEGIGPRYCPSVEDKVVRFAAKTSHQVFIEPEGLKVNEVYPNGISTSLPFVVQYELVRSMKGFEQARITRPGYAIEYDYFDPRDLKSTLETHAIAGLYFAGQINGTTGYEEAAAQGLLAAVNAVLKLRDMPPWWPSRDQAYMGVMVDDLITRGVTEPYRMFTSRAEYRLMLREDNADLRLTPIGRELGLVDDERFRAFETKREATEQELQRLRGLLVRPGQLGEATETRLFGGPLSKEARVNELLARPGTSYSQLMEIEAFGPGLADARAAEQVEIQIKYAGYFKRQQDEVARQQQHESLLLPDDLDYQQVHGLTTEAREKLSRIRPETLGQAGRIPGMTPAAVSLLLIHLKKTGHI